MGTDQNNGRLAGGRAVAAKRTPTRIVNGLVVFDLPPGSPPVTSEKVRELESELDCDDDRSGPIRS
jgi:hypothetical protein